MKRTRASHEQAEWYERIHNEADLEDLPQEVRDSLEIFLAEDLGEVLALTLRGASYKEGRLLFGDPSETSAPTEAALGGDGLPYAGSLH